ncbi:ketoacyl-ACP synthase III [Pseudenhygromyxa sp. WMMC2535]|uniref:3-oxoacyl-ACP synthase III family protein n=1 Tax=Pseudenhygromyxa sp. WMMC2535 TaxID=2712867 RepID=UPI001554E2B3|nr:ketoacyl-ACP synthase III [Pseudenhygromyxa sp. WMMC2535]NVB42423.1 ketoacyl-ACP synthase III [Pseudenhygromyxa sp. WMMC2535]
MTADGPAIPMRILGSGSVLPGPAITTAEVCARAYPGRDPEELVERTGIQTRHWAEAGTSHASLAADALRLALQRAGLEASALTRLIQVNCTGGDTLLPATANAIGDRLDLHGSCDCIDLNNACTGFLTALDVAARSAATGLHPVGVVVSELWSRHLEPADPRSFVVFGDAAAAVIIGPGRGDEGLRSSWLRNDGALRGSVTLAHSGLTGQREIVRFGVSNKKITQEATEAVLESAKTALRQADLSMDEIDWVLPHQPNGRMLDLLVRELGVEARKLVRVVHEIGSVGAASIPVSLDRLWRSGRLRGGERVLMVAVGSGISYGGMVYQVGQTP